MAFLFALFFLFGAGIIVRLFYLQIYEFSTYWIKSQAQQLRDDEFSRGDIFAQDKDGNLLVLATVKTFSRLYAIPSKIPLGKEAEVARTIAKQFNLSEKTLRERFIKKDDPYEPLKDLRSPEEVAKAKEFILQFPEMVKLQEFKDRFYPYGSLASHIIGLTGYEEERRIGLYGVEKFYESSLSRGDDILLTLDVPLQQQVENVLSNLIKRYQSPSGSIIIMRPRDGAILAMASKPDFDPNRYNETKDIRVFLNPAVQEVFEPGSIIKPVTMAAGLESGKVAPDTVYVDTGSVRKGTYIIRNAGGRTFGRRTMTEVLKFSINTGAVFVQEKVGQKDFLRVFEQFGFGERTGIDLPGEVSGDITNLDSGRPINFATASFGQGISATPIQVITALNVVANEGGLIRPYVAQNIISINGKRGEIKTETRREAIRKETAAKLVSMMVEVVEKGYSKKSRVPGYKIAGKTGTSQIPDPQGGYIDLTVHSFIGFAPAFDPSFIVLIKLDKPLGILFASDSIAPDFSQLAEYIFNYYGILPERAPKEETSGGKR